MIIAFCLFLVATCNAVDLRVACRSGQPPFNDVVSTNSQTCQGMFSDLFKLVAKQANLTYEMTHLTTANIDPFLMVQNNTSSSTFDVVIAFHSVTPARMKLYDFSIVVMQSTDSLALTSDYARPGSGLIAAVFRPSVMYIFSTLTALIGFMSIIIFFAEHVDESSDIHDVSPWQRFFWSIEMAFESAFCFSTSEKLSSQLSRSIRPLVAIVGLFLVTILGALITSQLTASSLNVDATDPSQIRGTSKKVAISSSTLKPYFDSLNVQTTLIDDINIFAQQYYLGAHSDYVGFCSSTEVVTYLHNVYSASKKGYLVTSSFMPTGSFVLKAFPMSKAVPSTIKAKFDLALQNIREDGELAGLIQQYVTAADAASQDTDVDISETDAIAVFSSGSIIYSLMIFASLGMYIQTKWCTKPKIVFAQPYDEPIDEHLGNSQSHHHNHRNSLSFTFQRRRTSFAFINDLFSHTAAPTMNEILYATGTGDTRLCWRGKVYSLSNEMYPHVRSLIDTIAEQSEEIQTHEDDGVDEEPEYEEAVRQNNNNNDNTSVMKRSQSNKKKEEDGGCGSSSGDDQSIPDLITTSKPYKK
eukprot:PhF_6_TR997/c0_g1_i3/m.1969